MNEARKAFVMLSAAVTMTSLGTAAAEAGMKKAPPPKGKQVKKQAKAKKGKVKKVRRARKRPSEIRPDFGMPAGTLYDVISAREV